MAPRRAVGGVVIAGVGLNVAAFADVDYPIRQDGCVAFGICTVVSSMVQMGILMKSNLERCSSLAEGSSISVSNFGMFLDAAK